MPLSSSPAAPPESDLEFSGLWQLTLAPLGQTEGQAMATTLEVEAETGSGDAALLAVSLCESAADGSAWRLEALFEGRPEADWLAGILGESAAAFDLVALTERDWVTLSQQDQKAVTAGRFHVHGGHLARHPSPAAIDLTIEAARAFGSGQHETTRGCLLAIDRLARARTYRRVLDLGTGSGVLALAAAKIWHGEVLAADIDPVATVIARENFRRHGLPHLPAVTAAGLRHRAIAARAPFDLILANILARPLIRLAPAIARHLAPGGRLVLSGLLDIQEAGVLAAYRAQGLGLDRRIPLGPWRTLILKN